MGNNCEVTLQTANDHNIHTIRNVQIDFPLGSFFRENITQYGDGRDVVRPEVTLPFAKI